MKGGIWPTKYGYQVRFGRGITRHFKSLQEAERFLTGIRYKVDEGSFDPRDYQSSNPLGFENLALKWLEIKQASVRRRSYNNLKNYMAQAIESWGRENIKNLGYGEIEDFLVSRLRIPMIPAGDSDGRRPSVPRQSGRFGSERSDAGFFLFSKSVF